jgi:hypothetical protein
MSYGPIHSAFLANLRTEALAFPFSLKSLQSASFDPSTVTPVTPRLISLEEPADFEEDARFEDEIGAEHVSETFSSRRSSKSANFALSRSVSPFSRSDSAGSNSNSPLSPARSSAEIESGPIPLGNALDPIIPPQQLILAPAWR